MASIDEYDAIPDAFEGIDFDAFPALRSVSLLSVPSLAALVPSPVPDVVRQDHSSASLSRQDPDDVFDESFFNEVDALVNAGVYRSLCTGCKDTDGCPVCQS